MSKVDRKYEILIYPDDPNADKYLSAAKSLFYEWAYCLHDQDLSQDGTHKKDHIHFIGHMHKQLTLKGVAFQIGCAENYVSYIKDYRAAIRYLIHADDKTKHQYNFDDIVSNYDIESFFTKKPNEQDMILQIIDHIYNNPHETITQLTKWVLDNKYWSAYRRSYSILKDIRLHEMVRINVKGDKDNV